MKSTLTDEYVEFRRADHKETVCLLSQARYLPSVFSYHHGQVPYLLHGSCEDETADGKGVPPGLGHDT